MLPVLQYEPIKRLYPLSGSSLEDVSASPWWSDVDVSSVDLNKKTTFAHLSPSDTYTKAWYKLLELEVALCSVRLSTDQVGAR